MSRLDATRWERLQTDVRENARGLHGFRAQQRSSGIDARRALSALAVADAERARDDILEEAYQFELTAPATKDGRPHPRVSYLFQCARAIRPALADGAGASV
jgi:hypothetical protein